MYLSKHLEGTIRTHFSQLTRTDSLFSLNSDSDSAESSPSNSRRGSLSNDVDDPRKLQVDYYLDALAKPTLSWIDVAALRSVIHRVTPQWLTTFVTSGGIRGIFEYLNKINTQVK